MRTKETQEAISGIIRKIAACPIPIRWRSQTIMPGGGERRSKSRGSSGYDVMARVEYEPGDDPRDIDWSATAQTGGQTMLVTQYLEPREVNVYVLVDVKKTMNFGTARATKRTLSAELTGSVIKSAGKTQDKVGFIAYSEKRLLQKRNPVNAKRALYPTIADVIETESAEDGEGSGLIKSLRSLPRNRALVFILSDFLSLTEDEKQALKRAALVHDIVSVVIQDRRERELPDGWGPYTLADMRTGKWKTIWLSAKNRAEFAANFQRHHDALLADLKAAHCDSAVFSTEEGDAALPKMMLLFGGHRR
jgi:uncharacterized protein (DUF58 family)